MIGTDRLRCSFRGLELPTKTEDAACSFSEKEMFTKLASRSIRACLNCLYIYCRRNAGVRSLPNCHRSVRLHYDLVTSVR
jgi:hypothetical protein